MAITIKDVAKLAGVSPSTVSRTCQNNPSISEITKQKVRSAMKELGYVPNFQASNLVTKSSKTIGIILPPTKKHTYQNTFFLEVIEGIVNCCNMYKYSNTIISGSSEKELIESINIVIKSGKVDGFIVLFSQKENKIIDYLKDNNYPFSIIGKPNKEDDFLFVDNDNILAGFQATNYLINLGHEKIAFLYDDISAIYVNDRIKGYKNALFENKIDYNECLKYDENIEDFFKEKYLPTGIIVIDDILALHLEKILTKLNISVPNDISIICFNNSLLTNLGNITCVDINNNKLGFMACKQIISNLLNKEEKKKIIVEHKIIERKTCKEII